MFAVMAPQPILFEAVCAPPCSFTPRAFRALAVLAALGAAWPVIVMLWLGAWPVLGFLGAELGLVLGLVAWHARRSARVVETLLLTGDTLSVTRSDARGRRNCFDLDPYWARARLIEDAGGTCRLLVQHREGALEIARSLGAEDKRALARALTEALSRYRNPVFDNPQLRDGA